MRATREPQLPRRRGAAAVEFAVVAPVVLFFFFGSVMFYGIVMTQNTMSAAVREGGRLASLPSVTLESAVVSAVENRLSRGGADSSAATVTVTPSQLGGLSTGDEVSVSVSMPMDRATWLDMGGILSGGTLTAEMTYIRE